MAEVAFRPVCQLSEYKGKGASASRESISFSNLKYGFENSENLYFQIRQQQGTLNLKERD